MAQQITLEEAVSKIENGMSVMVGGFIGAGVPDQLVLAICESKKTDLTVISNDTGILGDPMSQLIVKRCVKKLIVSHIGTNTETGKQMNAGELTVQLTPQGTLAEKIRAAGAGLGGVLTPTGIGTVVEKGKKKIEVDGNDYLLEVPLSADVAIIKAYKADRSGNLVYRRAARNFNPLMATASQIVIAQVDTIVEIGEIDPDEVMTPGLFVDFLVLGENKEVSKVG